MLAHWNIEEMRSRPGFHEELGRLKKEGQGFLIFAPGNTEIASLSDLFEEGKWNPSLETGEAEGSKDRI